MGPAIWDPMASPPKDAPGIGSGPALQENEDLIHRPDPLREDPNPRDLHWLRGDGSQDPAVALFYLSTRKGVEPSGRQPGRLRVAGSNWPVCWILSPSHSASSDQGGHKDTSPAPFPPRPTERPSRAGNQRHRPRGGPAGDSPRGLTGHRSAGDPGNPPPCGE